MKFSLEYRAGSCQTSSFPPTVKAELSTHIPHWYHNIWAFTCCTSNFNIIAYHEVRLVINCSIFIIKDYNKIFISNLTYILEKCLID